MNIFVLLYNSGTDKEGIHSIELKGRTIVLMFEDKDDATRYCGLLEAQDFPLPTVESINIEEIAAPILRPPPVMKITGFAMNLRSQSHSINVVFEKHTNFIALIHLLE